MWMGGITTDFGDNSLINNELETIQKHQYESQQTFRKIAMLALCSTQEQQDYMAMSDGKDFVFSFMKIEHLI
jgi:hypothetical protein